MSKEIKIFNQCVNEFKTRFRKIIRGRDLKNISQSRDLILEKVKPSFKLIDKDPNSYKEIIMFEFAQIVLKNISDEDELEVEEKEIHVEELFSVYIKNFWERDGMKFPMSFITEGWGGAGLIISNNKDWVGYPDSDISIYTNDYRFVLFTEEVYRLCNEITNYGNKYDFFRIIGRILKSHLKEDTELVMTKEIFDELCNSIWEFIKRESSYIQNINDSYNYDLERLKFYLRKEIILVN